MKSLRKFLLFVIVCFGFGLSIGLIALGVAIFENSDILKQIQETPRNEVITYIVSWIVLLLLSFAASVQIREIFISRASDLKRRRANQIAIMIAMVLIIVLFKQSSLNQLFENQVTNFRMNALLFGCGVTSGWAVWYLKQLEKYGEFFHVFLLASVVGICWYARLTAPKEVQLTVAAFLLGSLCKVAKDYIDEADAEP